MTINILHLSDIHFQDMGSYSRESVEKALIKSIKKHIEAEGVKPDIMAITGDIGYSGTEEEYAPAKKFLETLMSETSLKQEGLLLVPGNHDVNRKKVLPHLSLHRYKTLNEINSFLRDLEYSKKIMGERFGAYSQFVHDITGGALPRIEEKYFYTKSLKIEGKKISILGLNSAWASEDNNDEGKICLGEVQIKDALEEVGENRGVTVALMHHPLEWLTNVERQSMCQLLEDSCHIILYGHLHESKPREIRGPKSVCVYLPACAAYEDRKEGRNGFQWLQINTDQKSVTIQPYIWTEEHAGKFLPKERFTLFFHEEEPEEVTLDVIDKVFPAIQEPYIAHPYSLQSNFTGRIKERKDLTNWYCQDPCPILSLTAIGGMGKSALVWIWLHLDVLRETIPGVELDTPEIKQECNIIEEDKPDGIFQWSFYLGEISFNQFLASACKYTGGEPEPSSGQELITDDDRLRTLIPRLNSKRYLVILDGFERLLRAYGAQDAALLEEKPLSEYSSDERRCSDILVVRFLEGIISSTRSKFLITTRLTPYEIETSPGFNNYFLKGLNDDDAIRFMRTNNIVGLDRALKRAANEYDNHPKSLGHLITVINDDIEYPGDIRAAPKYDVTMDVKGKQHQIQERAFKILPNNIKEFLMNISAIRKNFTYEFLQLVNNNLSLQGLQEYLNTVEKMRWIAWDKKEKRISFHPLTRRFLYLKLKESGRTEAIHEILRGYWEKKVEINDKEKLRQILTQDISLYDAAGAVRLSGISEQLQDFLKEIKLGQLLTDQLDDLPDDQKEFIRIIVEFQKEIINDRLKKIESLDEIQPVIELYYHTVGAGALDEAFSLMRERLLPNPIHFQFGAYSLSIEIMGVFFEDAGYRSPKIKDKRKMAVIYNGLGISHSLSGQPRLAVPLFENYIQINADFVRKVFPKYNWRDIATFLKGEYAKKFSFNLDENAKGLINLTVSGQFPIGDLESAESSVKRTIEITKEIEVKHSEGIAHRELGKALLLIGEYKESVNEFDTAINLFQEIGNIQSQTIVWIYRSLRTLFIDDPEEALNCANKSLEFAKKTAEEQHTHPRDFILASWLIGASYVAMSDTVQAEKPLNFAITKCRKINLVELEADILLSIAKLRHVQKRDDECLKLATEALETSNRCDYVLQQADIHLFLAEFYKDKGDIPKAKEQAELAKLRSHQMINVETGDYITKPEDTKWKYKPCYDKAVAFLSSLPT
ncbi:MAG: metallophosphoesterase [Methanomassiliicoccales archaeon]|nr:MAG: metallophosphoesterase [Methanomassiliicoccales archaeon]